MSNSNIPAARAIQADAATANRAILAVFTLAIFSSAFLLFSVQPMFTKMVLPQLGGTPAVWSVAMVFFQAVLLAGYGYAHLIVKRLPFRASVYVHLSVMLLALFAMPIAAATSWGEPPQSGQATWLIGLFAVSVGLPFFAVSANGPLLQAWFSRTGHPHAADPYFLYGASNIGSFASLIAYVVLFETLFPLGSQSVLWSAGFILLGIMITGCAMAVGYGRALNPDIAQAVPERMATTVAAGVAWRDRINWITLAFIPSGLLVAVTAHLTVDVASIPLLWIVPLSLFLLTFVFAFASRPRISIASMERLLPAAAMLVLASLVFGDRLPFAVQLVVHTGHFFLAALLAHSVLASKRPQASDLTGFYLWMSFGGVLGGAFATLAAPHLFNWLAEYPLLVVAALFIRPGFWAEGQRQVLLAVLLGSTAALLTGYAIGAKSMTLICLVAMAGAGAFHILRLIRDNALALLSAFVLCSLFVWKAGDDVLYAKRSFFGVLEARLSADGHFVEMVHGNTIHGRMDAKADGRPVPLSYYHASGGIADALFASQDMSGGRNSEVGVVGLGAGSLICHRRETERWSHYEIDHDVVELARDSRYFRFMEACETPADRMILGDARLTLRKEPSAFFDYLLLDAFSSNSIPVHLITREAIAMYMEKLKRDGVLVMHISNRYMDLAPVVDAIGRDLGLKVRIGTFWPDQAALEAGAKPSMVAALTRDQEMVARLERNPAWKEPAVHQSAVWTDAYSNVLSAIWNRARPKHD